MQRQRCPKREGTARPKKRGKVKQQESQTVEITLERDTRYSEPATGNKERQRLNKRGNGDDEKHE